MKKAFRNYSLIFFLVSLVVLVLECGQDANETNGLKDGVRTEGKEPVLTQDQQEVKATVERFLFVAGNYNLEAMAEMMTAHANVGIARIQGGESVITTMTIQEYLQRVKERTLQPYFEPVGEYTIHVTDGHLAFVKADATLYRYGVPQSRNMDYFTLMKEKNTWKFLSLAYTPTPIPESEKVIDLKVFGKSYAQAWCSQRPDFVALFYAENGSLTVNNGIPAVGRDGVAKVAESFMTAFPDIIVSMDSLRTTSEGIEFHWTFTGTTSGPNGTGNKVKISGFELWQLNDQGLIKESQGTFDAEEYDRQVKHGINN